MTETLSGQLNAAAETLAAQVEQGEFSALSVEQRFQLRWLALRLSAWSDRVATMEAELAAAQPDSGTAWQRTIANRRLAKAAVVVWGANLGAVAAICIILALR